MGAGVSGISDISGKDSNVSLSQVIQHFLRPRCSVAACVPSLQVSPCQALCVAAVVYIHCSNTYGLASTCLRQLVTLSYRGRLGLSLECSLC